MSDNGSLFTMVDANADTLTDESENVNESVEDNSSTKGIFSKQNFIIITVIVIIIIGIILIVFFTQRSGFKPEQPRTGPQSDFDLDSSLQKLIARQETALHKKMERDTNSV